MLYTLLFVGAAILEVMGMIPQEIKSSGITIESILSKYFGDEVRIREIKTVRAIFCFDYRTCILFITT